MSHGLLQTKFYRPRTRHSNVLRRRLSEQLEVGLDGKLTLVTAPAGFGKTTTVAEWLRQNDEFATNSGTQQNSQRTLTAPARTYCWLSLDADDNDPSRFLVYVIAALQTALPGLGQTAIALLQSPQPLALHAVLTLLINELATIATPIILVLDDYHTISTPAVHEAVTYLLDHQPPGMHLIIISRGDPLLPLARWRAQRELVELRAADLRFTVEESAAFLNTAMGLDLTPADVAALEARTEGWITGLQLAGFALQAHSQHPDGVDTSEFIQAFAGSHRYIVGYLLEEVLNHRPQGTMEFLLQTSILDAMCGPLCDYVLGEATVRSGDNGRADDNLTSSLRSSQTILEKLEHANLFIVSLDDEGKWYRYHHLFAQVLLGRLQKLHSDRVSTLHFRASEWYEQASMISEAVRHALEAEAWEQAARLIERVSGDMLRKGASVSLLRWLDALPEETLRARPRLCLARGWTFVWGPVLDLAGANEWAQLAAQAASAEESSELSLQGEVAALQAMTATTWDDGTRNVELSRRALAYLPADSPWRGVMNFCLGSAHYSSGDLVAASDVLNEALMLIQADGVHYIRLIAASLLADIYVSQGSLSRAEDLYQQVLTWGDKGPPQKGAVMAHGGLATILCERNQLDSALLHLQVGVEQLPQVGGVWPSLAIYRALAAVRQAQGNWTEALAALDRASQSAASARQSVVIIQLAALRARLQLAQGDLAPAKAWAANCGLGLDDLEINHPGLREDEYLSFGRILAFQGRYAEALSLLDRLLQPAEAKGRIGSVIVILILQSLISQAQDKTVHAVTLLKRALILAEPQGYIRTFLNEGKPLRRLLYVIRSQHKQHPRFDEPLDGAVLAYVEMLLAAFEAEGLPSHLRSSETGDSVHDAASGVPMLEPLNQREREILSFIAQGFSNREIADRLVVAQSTVKWYINRLYGKLDAKSRTHALVRARELGLL